MLELTSYGLTGLVVVLAVACYLIFDDAAPTKNSRSFDSINNARSLGSPGHAEKGSDTLHIRTVRRRSDLEIK
jgi:hypothetical protein